MARAQLPRRTPKLRVVQRSGSLAGSIAIPFLPQHIKHGEQAGL